MTYASVWDAREYTPGAEGAPDIRVRSVLEDANAFVRRIAPPPPLKKVGLREAITSTDTTVPVGTVATNDPLLLRHFFHNIFDFAPSGIVQIDSEKIAYENIDPDNLKFINLERGFDNTTAASHNQYADVIDVTYPYVAKRAELRVFDYLWLTGGNALSVNSPIGSGAQFVGQGTLKSTIVQMMGDYALANTPVYIK